MTNSATAVSSLDNVKSYMDEYAELRRSAKRIETRLKELDPVIRPALEGRGAVVYNGAQFECKMVAGRKTLDKKAVEEYLSEHGADITDFEKQGAPFTQMNVKIVNEL